MSKFWAIVCALFLWPQAYAQGPAPPTNDFTSLVRRVQSNRPMVSASGQFAVYRAPEEGWPAPRLNPNVQTNYVQVDPGVLVVVCDRIRSAVIQNLGVQDMWQGRIFIYLREARNLDEPIFIPPPQNPQTYTLFVPDKVGRNRLISAIVAAVLEEIADRNAPRPAEIPAWLVDGLAREVAQEHPHDLVFSSAPFNPDALHLYSWDVKPPLERAQEVLRQWPPLTIDQLSWPAPGQADDEVYTSSAQLFVQDLLRLNDGRQCMWAFLPALTHHLNWQVSFMEAFHSDFTSQLDLEKWWVLCLMNFTGRDLSGLLTSGNTRERLDVLLEPEVEVRESPDQIPTNRTASLQEIIVGWTPAMQEQTLKNTLGELTSLQIQASRDVKPLVEAYCDALETYIKARDKSGVFRNKKKRERLLGLDKPAAAAVERLDALDTRRQQTPTDPNVPLQQARGPDASN